MPLVYTTLENHRNQYKRTYIYNLLTNISTARVLICESIRGTGGRRHIEWPQQFLLDIFPGKHENERIAQCRQIEEVVNGIAGTVDQMYIRQKDRHIRYDHQNRY